MRDPRESSPMSVGFVVALDCRIVVAGHTSTVLCLRRVVADRCCMFKDMSYHYSS